MIVSSKLFMISSLLNKSKSICSCSLTIFMMGSLSSEYFCLRWAFAFSHSSLMILLIFTFNWMNFLSKSFKTWLILSVSNESVLQFSLIWVSLFVENISSTVFISWQLKWFFEWFLKQSSHKKLVEFFMHEIFVQKWDALYLLWLSHLFWRIFSRFCWIFISLSTELIISSEGIKIIMLLFLSIQKFN